MQSRNWPGARIQISFCQEPPGRPTAKPSPVRQEVLREVITEAWQSLISQMAHKKFSPLTGGMELRELPGSRTAEVSSPPRRSGQEINFNCGRFPIPRARRSEEHTS